MIKKNKFIVWLLTIVMIVSALGGTIYDMSANSYDKPSVVLLESIINGERKWVENTIVDDYRYGNPYGDGESLMHKALSQYGNMDDPDYKLTYTVMVDMLTEYYYQNTWKQDLEAFAVDNAVEIAELFVDDASFLTFADDLKKSAEEEQYENILYSVFMDEYVSSWGESINEQEQSLQHLTEMSEMIDNLSKVIAYWEELYNVSNVQDEENIIGYLENVAKPLFESGTEYLKSFNSLEGTEQQVTGSAISIASALAMANWALSYSKNYAGTTLGNDLMDYIAGSEAQELLSKFNTSIDITAGLLNQYTFLNSIFLKQDTYYDTLVRMSEQAETDGETKMSIVFQDYADKMDAAVNENELNYEVLISQIAATSTIKESLKLSSAMKAGMPSQLKYAYEKGNYAGLAKVFSVGMTIIDGATGLKSTCLKTAELKYLNTMILEARRVYNADLEIYINDKTEANARKVLTDLMILQRLRLRGENIAYKMTKDQLNSWIGRLVSGYNSGDWTNLIDDDTDLATAWKQHYQNSVDCLIGASINPVSYDSFEVNAGEKLFVYYNDEKGTYEGAYTVDEKTAYIYEMQHRILSGISLNGGELIIGNAAVPFVEVTGSGNSITIDASTASIGELTQSGNLDLKITKADLEFQNSLDLSNADLTLNGYEIVTPDFTVSNTVTINDGSITTKDFHLNNAEVTGGNITCTGNIDIEGDNSSCEQLKIDGDSVQNIIGNLQIGDLTLDNAITKGIEVDGTMSVTGTLIDPENIVSTPIVLNSTASISGDKVASDVILDGTTITSPVLYARGVEIQDESSVCGGTIKGSLTVVNGTLTNTGDKLELKNGIVCSAGVINADAEVHIYTDAYFNKAATTGDLYLYGDSSYEGTENRFSDLYICGYFAQDINFSGNVERLTIVNTSLTGVNFLGDITISEKLLAKDQRISNENRLVLTGSASAELVNVNGNLGIKDWRGNLIGGLNGTLYCTGDNVISNDMVLDGGISQESGSVVLDSAIVECGGSFEQLGTFGVQQDSQLIIEEDSVIQNVTIDETSLCDIDGDLQVPGTIAGDGELAVAGNIESENTYSMGKLRINGNKLQTVNGADISVSELILENEGLQGINFQNDIMVTEKVTALSQKISNGKHILLTGTAASEISNMRGDLTISNWNGEWAGSLTGILYSTGDNIISTNMEIDGGVRQQDGSLGIVNASIVVGNNFEQVTGVLNIDASSSLTAKGDASVNGTVNNEGSVEFDGDTVWNTPMSGTGTLVVKGDLNIKQETEILKLVCSGTRKQDISGSDFTVHDLTMQNNSLFGVQLDAQIYVTGEYLKEGRVYGKKPLQKLVVTSFTEDTKISSVTTSELIDVGANIQFTVTGNANLSGGMTIHSGSTVVIQGNLIMTSGDFIVEENAKVIVKGNVILSSVVVTLDGELDSLSDSKYTNGTIQGIGTLILKGDLINNATISDMKNLTISGKAPLKIEGNEIHVAQVHADNNSRSGVNLETKLFYSDSVTIAESCVITEDNLVEETE